MLLLASVVVGGAMAGGPYSAPAAPSSGVFGGSLTAAGALAQPMTQPASSRVAAWGRNVSGQLGDGITNFSTDSPVAVSALSEVTAVAAGEEHSLALLSSGTAMAWGDNYHGELGTGSSQELSDVPVSVSGLSEVTAIATGSYHDLALLGNGTVVAWGANFWGQLGNGNETDSRVPVAVSGLSGVKAIAACGANSFALLTNGTVMAWGWNGFGQLGNGTYTNSDVPATVSGLSSVRAIACAEANGMALLTNGTVMAWGDNYYGQLGNGTTTESNTPVAVSGLSEVTAIAGGGSQSLALLNNGTVKAWGDNESGALGTGSTTGPEVCGSEAPCSRIPVTVTGLSEVTAIAGGHRHGLALLSGGTVKAWGRNESGQLGNGSSTNSDVPVAVSGVSEAIAIAGGGGYSLAVGTPPVPPPTVAKVVPASGSWAGGTPVTISGTNLTGATAVKFGSTNAASFAVSSETSITAVSPAGAGAVDVTVTTPGGTSPTSSADRFSYVPVLTKIEPSRGPVTGGTSVTITGSGLTGATSVKFGSSNAASFSANSESSITAVTPPGAGTVDVTVTTPGGTSATGAADRFTYGVSVTKVEPDEGALAGGTAVTVTGTGFTGATAVKFGSSNATSFKVESETTLSAVSPAGTGIVDVTVSAPEGTSPTGSADQFSYAPVVTSVSPKSGEESGGTSVTITGTNFTGASGVKFGSKNAASFKVESETTIKAVSPSGKYEVDVTVTSSGATSATSTADRFHYDGPSTCSPRESEYPIITSVQPSSGPAAGGNSVKIRGKRFVVTAPCEPPSAAIAEPIVRKVMFGSKEATSFKEETGFKEGAEGMITAVAPPGAGTVDVTVEREPSTSPTGPADRYTYVPPSPALGTCSVSSITQSSATLCATVNPNGTEVTECKFEYGPTTSYGSSAPCSPPPGSGGSPVSVSAAISGLSANTTYHFRISATNAGGASNASDETFKTLQAPVVCGPANAPGGQGTAGVCSWYSAGQILPAATPRVFLFWGGFTNAALSQATTLGQISCKAVGYGTAENPSGGGAGAGRIFGFGFYSCSAPKCEQEAQEAAGGPGRTTVTALNLPWKQSLSVSGSPESVRDHIGTAFSGTFGAPSLGEVDVKVSCEVAATGKLLRTASFEGELEPQIGIAAGPGPGLNGSPSEISFTEAGGGALHSEAGGEATFSGSVKYLQYFPSGSLEVW